MLADGDVANRQDVATVHQEHQTAVDRPVQNAAQAEAAGPHPAAPKKGAKPALAAWRVRRGTEAGPTSYRQGAATAALVNAPARNRGW